MKLKFVLSAAMVVGLVAVVSGQPAPAPAVPASTPFQVTADHDGLNTTGYRCYVDSAKVGADLPVSARVSGRVSCSMPGLGSGNHTVAMSAFNTFGENLTPALTITVGARPNPLSNMQIVLNVIINKLTGNANIDTIHIVELP